MKPKKKAKRDRVTWLDFVRVWPERDIAWLAEFLPPNSELVDFDRGKVTIRFSNDFVFSGTAADGCVVDRTVHAKFKRTFHRYDPPTSLQSDAMPAISLPPPVVSFDVCRCPFGRDPKRRGVLLTNHHDGCELKKRDAEPEPAPPPPAAPLSLLSEDPKPAKRERRPKNAPLPGQRELPFAREAPTKTKPPVDQ